MCCNKKPKIHNDLRMELEKAGAKGVVLWKVLRREKRTLTSPCNIYPDFKWVPGTNVAKPNGTFDPLGDMFKYKISDPAGIHVFTNAEEVKFNINHWVKKGCVVVPVKCFKNDFIRAGKGNFDGNTMEQAVFKKVTLEKNWYKKALNKEYRCPLSIEKGK